MKIGSLCLARLRCLISLSRIQGPVHRHLFCWTLDMMIQMTRLQLRGRASSLNCPFFAIEYVLESVLRYQHILSFCWSEQIVWNYPSHFKIALWEKSV